MWAACRVKNPAKKKLCNADLLGFTVHQHLLEF